MRTLSLIVQWMVLLAVLAGTAFILWRPQPRPDYQPETWNTWEGVTVLSYAGISRRGDPSYPSVETLEAHLTALRDAGYRTVRPADVRAFLEGRAPLPSKALLLLFENGRKEAIIRATPLLQRTGFMAVMVAPTAYIHKWGSFYLKRSDLRRVARLPQWEVGSMGHDAADAIDVAGDGATGRFLSQRRWLGMAGLEADETFRQRILGDYLRSSALLASATGEAPLLYLYPFGEAGQLPGNDPLAEAVNRAGVTAHFPLAVLGNGDAFNGPGSDPYALTRLRVPGLWSAGELMRALELNRPRREGFDGLGRSDDWLFERGGGLSEGGLVLGDGDAAWLRGTDGWTDQDLRVTLRLAPGAMGALYARYGHARAWLRVTLAADGVRLQESVGGRVQTLHHHVAGVESEGLRTLRLRVRNNRAWIWLDGEALGGNLPVAATIGRGRVGLGSQGGGVTVTALGLTSLPGRLALAEGLGAIPEPLRAELQTLLPRVLKAGEPPLLSEAFEQDLLLAAAAGIETIPLVAGAAAITQGEGGAAWVADLDALLSARVLTPLIRSVALEGPAPILAAALRERGYGVVHVLKAADAIAQAPTLCMGAGAADRVVIDETGAAAEQALDLLLHTIAASRVALLEPAAAVGPEGLRTAVMASDRVVKE